jgi:hypothetical protein
VDRLALVATEGSSRVNSVASDDAALLDPAAADGQLPAVTLRGARDKLAD